MAACSSNGMQSICFFYYYYYFIIRDEFEFDDLKYCVLISVLRLTHGARRSFERNNGRIHGNHGEC